MKSDQEAGLQFNVRITVTSPAVEPGTPSRCRVGSTTDRVRPALQGLHAILAPLLKNSVAPVLAQTISEASDITGQ